MKKAPRAPTPFGSFFVLIKRVYSHKTKKSRICG